MSIIADFILALFPTLIIYKLQMRLKVKIGVACIMGLGVLSAHSTILAFAYAYDPHSAGAAAIARVYQIRVIAHTRDPTCKL